MPDSTNDSIGRNYSSGTESSEDIRRRAGQQREQEHAAPEGEDTLTPAQRELLEGLPDATVADPGLAFEPAALEAIVLLRRESPAKWETLRAKLGANRVRFSGSEGLDSRIKRKAVRMDAARRARSEEATRGGRRTLTIDESRPNLALGLLQGVLDTETCAQTALRSLPALPLLFSHLGRAVFIDSGEVKGAAGARLGHRTMKATASQLYGMIGHVVDTGYRKNVAEPEEEPSFVFVHKPLPHEIASAYLMGNWHNTLPRIEAITSTPIVTPNGCLVFSVGFHEAQGVLMEHCIDTEVPEQPTFAEASAALLVVRDFFKASAFADRSVVAEEPPTITTEAGPLFAGPAAVADVTAAPRLTNLSKPPGKDESAFLSALLTPFVLRCGEKVPGHMFTAPPIVGSGTGKTAMAQSCAIIASGRPMNAIATDVPREELEKRIGGAIAAGVEALFLSNANDGGRCLTDTERLITDTGNTNRLLGTSNMTKVPDALLVYSEGNGLRPPGDSNRRWVVCSMDTGLEFASAVRHDGRFLVKVRRERARLLTALLTILRWGCQGRVGGLPLDVGRAPAAAFPIWREMVRDTLMGLGCADVLAGQQARGRLDPRRAAQGALFDEWESALGGKTVTRRELLAGAAGPLRELIGLLDERRRPQVISNAAERLVGVTNGNRRIRGVDGVGRVEPARGVVHRTHPVRAWQMVDLSWNPLPEPAPATRQEGGCPPEPPF